MQAVLGFWLPSAPCCVPLCALVGQPLCNANQYSCAFGVCVCMWGWMGRGQSSGSATGMPGQLRQAARSWLALQARPIVGRRHPSGRCTPLCPASSGRPKHWHAHASCARTCTRSTHACPTHPQVKDLGAKAGVVLNPGTSLSAIEEVLDVVDLILIMSVNPGFGGQKFIESQVAKIRALKKMCNERVRRAVTCSFGDCRGQGRMPR